MSVQSQMYVFPGRNGWAWCELFTAEGHFVAPTPFRSVADAVVAIQAGNPSAYVDWLDEDTVPAEVRRAEACGGSVVMAGPLSVTLDCGCVVAIRQPVRFCAFHQAADDAIYAENERRLGSGPSIGKADLS